MVASFGKKIGESDAKDFCDFFERIDPGALAAARLNHPHRGNPNALSQVPRANALRFSEVPYVST